MNNRFKSFTPQEIGVVREALITQRDLLGENLGTISWQLANGRDTEREQGLLTRKLESQIALKVTKELLAELEQEHQ